MPVPTSSCLHLMQRVMFAMQYEKVAACEAVSTLNSAPPSRWWEPRTRAPYARDPLRSGAGTRRMTQSRPTVVHCALCARGLGAANIAGNSENARL